MSNEVRSFHCCANGDDTTHGLSDESSGLVDFGYGPGDKIIDAGDACFRRRRAEPRPSDVALGRWMNEEISDRLPETGVPGSARKEE